MAALVPLSSAHVSWRKTHHRDHHDDYDDYNQPDHRYDYHSPMRSEVGIDLPAETHVSWSSIPSPFREAMQDLAGKGDVHATHAVEKWDDWKQWKHKYLNGSYASAAAEVQAFRAFIENDMVIDTHNADHASSYYSLGHSAWSAHSFHEFENLMFPVKYSDIMPPSYASVSTHKYLDQHGRPLALPESVDWTQKGAVSPVMNQGECGSCWCAPQPCAAGGTAAQLSARAARARSPR